MVHRSANVDSDKPLFETRHNGEDLVRQLASSEDLLPLEEASVVT